jgi:hypothetical protein
MKFTMYSGLKKYFGFGSFFVASSIFMAGQLSAAAETDSWSLTSPSRRRMVQTNGSIKFHRAADLFCD